MGFSGHELGPVVAAVTLWAPRTFESSDFKPQSHWESGQW
jgi:hypothetical protein